MTTPVTLRVLALPAGLLTAMLSWFCAALSLWSLNSSPLEQLVEGVWLLVASVGSGAIAVATARIVTGRRGTSWWMTLGAVPGVVAALAIFVPWF